MLEDDVRAATQQVLVAGRPSRSNSERDTKPPDRPKPSERRQEGPSRPEMPPLTPLSISHEKLLPMIQDLSDFKWPRPIGTDPSTRDRSRRCAFHKDHGHTTETCRYFQYLVERLCRPPFWGSDSCIFMQLVLPSVATPGDHMASFNWQLQNQLWLFEELSRGNTCRRMLGGILQAVIWIAEQL